MFAVGDLVIYGGEGVCRVAGIGPSGLSGDNSGLTYYHLLPLYRNGTVMTPVTTSVLMRPILTRPAALELIASLPSLPAVKPVETGLRAVRDFYHALVQRSDCSELAALIHTVCRKRAWSLAHGKKASQMDERYLKRAEEQLYGELAAALELEREQVLPFIRQSYPHWPEELPAAGEN